MENEHLRIYEELLKYIGKLNNAWYCLPKEMVGWWNKRINSIII